MMMIKLHKISDGCKQNQSTNNSQQGSWATSSLWDTVIPPSYTPCSMSSRYRKQRSQRQVQCFMKVWESEFKSTVPV